MANIKESFGKISPNAYVKSVKIEEGPSITTRVKNSKNKSAQVATVKNYDGTIGYSSKKDAGTPVQDGSTSISLNVSVKDVINSSTKKATWLSNPKTRQNFNVKVLLVYNKDLETEILRQNSLDKYPIIIPQEYNKFLDWQEKTISLSNEGTGKYSTELNDSSGNVIASQDYKFDFDVPQKNPDHLTCFVFSEFNPANPLKSNVNVHSMVTIEKIIENSSVVNEATYYETLDGLLWTGPVHYHLGRPMEGAIHTTMPHNNLNVRTVFNFKTQDLRVFSEISKLNVNISPEQQQFQKNYISNLYLSRNKEGGASFVFNYNHLELLINKSKFVIMSFKMSLSHCKPNAKVL